VCRCGLRRCAPSLLWALRAGCNLSVSRAPGFHARCAPLDFRHCVPLRPSTLCAFSSSGAVRRLKSGRLARFGLHALLPGWAPCAFAPCAGYGETIVSAIVWAFLPEPGTEGRELQATTAWRATLGAASPSNSGNGRKQHVLVRSIRCVFPSEFWKRGAWLASKQHVLVRNIRCVFPPEFWRRGAWLASKQHVLVRNLDPAFPPNSGNEGRGLQASGTSWCAT
jgi:hypothetical protein